MKGYKEILTEHLKKEFSKTFTLDEMSDLERLAGLDKQYGNSSDKYDVRLTKLEKELKKLQDKVKMLSKKQDKTPLPKFPKLPKLPKPKSKK